MNLKKVQYIKKESIDKAGRIRPNDVAKFARVGQAYINLDNVTGFYLEKRKDLGGEDCYAVMADAVQIEMIYDGYKEAKNYLAELITELTEADD